MVTVVNPVPHPAVVRETVCRNCGVTLSYVPADIKERVKMDYLGDKDHQKFITCPSCEYEVVIRL